MSLHRKCFQKTMAEENMYENLEVRKYLLSFQVPETIEALLTVLAFYKPQNPLKHVLLHLHRIQSGEFHHKALSWDSFIKRNDLPVQRVFKPCFLEQHIFDNPFLRKKHHLQMIIAIEHNSKVQLKKYFRALKAYHNQQLAKRTIIQRNTMLADEHFSTKISRRILIVWRNQTKIYTVNVEKAIKILLKSLSYTYLSKCFMKWHLFTRDIHWKNNYFQKQALRQNVASDPDNPCQKDHFQDVDNISRLPPNVAAKIFKYLDLKSRMSCSMVCNTWHALLQECTLYTELDLTNAGFEINDGIFSNILRRYKFFLYHIKLENCVKISPKCLENLKDCKNLQDIDLSGCNTTAHLLQQLGLSCPFLTYMNLSNSKCDDTCFANIAKNFPCLKYLDLSYCTALSEAGFYYLVISKSLKSLAHINLSGCPNVNGNCLANIGQCCVLLTSFILDNIPNLTDSCISKLAATCGRLRILSLIQAIKITDRGLKYIATNLVQLEKFYFEGNRFVTDSGVAEIMGSRNMQHIHFVDCLRLYDTALKPCINSRALTVINLTDCVRLTDAGIKHILDGPAAAHLHELSLTNCIRVGDKSIQKLVNCSPNLAYLSIAYCENVTDVGIAMLATHPTLRMLDVSGCSITDYGAGYLRQSQKLEYLSMAECNLITDIGIERMANLENLKYLDISYCTNISDYGMKMLIYENKCLTHLNIGGCKLITNSTLTSIASVCIYLVKLNISEVKNITDAGIRNIRIGCKNLKYLNVSYCPKLNYGSISKLIQHGCRVVHTMNVG